MDRKVVLVKENTYLTKILTLDENNGLDRQQQDRNDEQNMVSIYKRTLKGIQRTVHKSAKRVDRYEKRCSGGES